jgi:hypothetical protein
MDFLLTEDGERIELEDGTGDILLESSSFTGCAADVFVGDDLT